MEWGWVLIYALAILGAGAIAGGIIAYRSSVQPGVRSFAAASIASGVVMLLIVSMVVPISYDSGSGFSPDPVVSNRTVSQ